MSSNKQDPQKRSQQNLSSLFLSNEDTAPQSFAKGYYFGKIAESKSIRYVKLPSHSLQIDEKRFLSLLAGSISLGKEEKKKIIESIPRLSQFQIDELIKIFEEERKKFKALNESHLTQLMALEKKHLQEWEEIELEYHNQSLDKKLDDLLSQ